MVQNSNYTSYNWFFVWRIDMKKALIVILALSVCFVFAACDDNSADSIESTSIDTITQEQTDGTESSTDTDIVYGTEDTWEEDGLFSITINSATPTDERKGTFIIEY